MKDAWNSPAAACWEQAKQQTNCSFPSGCVTPGPATHMSKGGRMIVLQTKNIALSLIFPGEKRTPFFQKRWLEAPEKKTFQWKC